RFGAPLLAQEFADDLVQLPAIQQVAPPQVPNKPLTGSEFSGDHGASFDFRAKTAPRQAPPPRYTAGVEGFLLFVSRPYSFRAGRGSTGTMPPAVTWDKNRPLS